MSDSVLTTTGLGKRFGSRWAVHDLDLDIREGDIYGFLGPNGAGKSTTIRMVLSLIRPTTGSVRIFGHALLTDRSAALRHVGGIVEKPDFYLYLSARRNLDVVGSLVGGIEKRRVDEVLDLVGLLDRAADPVKTYSHGMKQRLGIAQALLTDPKLVILDEPTNGLDPHGMKEIRDLITSLARDRKKTILLSSHLLNEVEMIATRMVIINRGEKVVEGNVQELLGGGETRVLIRAEPRRTVRAVCQKMKQRIREVRDDGDGVSVSIDPADVPTLVRSLVAARVKVHAIAPRRSLEEYFLTITENAERR